MCSKSIIVERYLPPININRKIAKMKAIMEVKVGRYARQIESAGIVKLGVVQVAVIIAGKVDHNALIVDLLLKELERWEYIVRLVMILCVIMIASWQLILLRLLLITN